MSKVDNQPLIDALAEALCIHTTPIIGFPTAEQWMALHDAVGHKLLELWGVPMKTLPTKITFEQSEVDTPTKEPPTVCQAARDGECFHPLCPGRGRPGWERLECTLPDRAEDNE